MAKWVECNAGWINISRIDLLTTVSSGSKWTVYANGIYRLRECDNEKEAETFIKEFVEEHYINTGKIT